MVRHLKTRIALTVTLLILGLLAMIDWFGLVYFKREFESLTSVHLSSTLDAAVLDAAQRLRYSNDVLLAIDRAVPRALLSDRQALSSVLRRFAVAPLTFDAGLKLLAPDGRLLASAPGAAADISLQPAEAALLAEVVRSAGPAMSPPFRLPAPDNRPVLMLGRPLVDAEGRILAVLAGLIDLTGASSLARLPEHTIGREGHLLVIDRAGTVVLAPDPARLMAAGKDFIPPPALAEILTRPAGEQHNVPVLGREMLLMHRAVAGTSWAIVGLSPEEEVRLPLRRAGFFALLALLLLSLVSVVAIRFLSNRLTAPLLTLADEVRRQLNPAAPVELPPDGRFEELGELSDSIQRLMAALGEQRQELKAQLFFLQNLIDTIPSPIFYKDAAFRYLGCNQAFSQYIGMSRSELVGKSVYEIAPRELAEVYDRADRELWAQGAAQVYEATVKYADGSLHEVIFYKSVFKDVDGQPAGLIGVFLDITERKQVEARLQRALAEADAEREKIDNILRSAADGMVVTNRSNRVTHINQVALELLGVKAEEVLNRSYTRLFRDPLLLNQVRTFLSSRDISARQQDFTLPRGDGPDAMVIQARTTPLRDRNGRLTGLVTLLCDVTRERQLDLLKSEFISTAAHEMRTPMSVIIGYAELLLDQAHAVCFDEAQKQEFLHEICRKAEALSRLVDDLFDISRIEAGLPLLLERSDCDLNAIAAEVIQRFAARDSRHRFIMELAPLRAARVDCNKIAQVFDNLISNAVKYSPHGGRITVRSEFADAVLRFAVSDEGIGMTEQQVARVFEKFYRVDSSDTAVGGLGIGMSIVKMIVETHGGRIWLESQPEAGTTVLFELPLA